MGGGGSYYDRDVTSSVDTTRGGRSYSAAAEKLTSRSQADAAVLPKDKVLRTNSLYPVYWDFDHTGSMGDLPRICTDKAPMIVGEVTRCGYLPEGWELGIGVIGDVLCDDDPIQFGDFSKPRNADEWIQRLRLEGGGGGNGGESYEMAAYFLANRCEMPNAVEPMAIFTADEPLRETLPSATLNKHFGGEHENTSAKQAFGKLQERFKGNAVLIRRPYGNDKAIEKQWERVLGKGRIVRLETDRAIGDLVVGTIALLSGARTLEEYIEDVKNRPTNLGNTKFEPQSPERIAEIGRALKDLDGFCEEKFAGKRGRVWKEAQGASADAKKSKGGDKKKKDDKPADDKKPGWLL